MKSPTTVFLIDNGSLRPQATLALRALAGQLSTRAGCLVEPVSLLHSHKVDASALGGEPATIVRRRLRECVEAGERSFIMLPLFLGPSSAIRDYLPELVEEARQMAPDLSVRIADPLAGADVRQPDTRLAQMLADHVRALVARHEIQRSTVALVDHGTPVEPVNVVRNAVAAQLSTLLGSEVLEVVASSMERREGTEYAFNEPLLERIDTVAKNRRDCIVAMFFLLPGRHAGEGGDVVEICDGLRDQGIFENVYITPLLGEHSLLLEVLEDRLRVCL